MAWLYGFSIRRPRLIIAAALLVTLAVAPGVVKLRLRTDGHALVPAFAREIRADLEIRERFGIEDPVVVLITSAHPDGLFNTRTLERIVDLTKRFKAIEGIHPWNVFSLLTEPGYRVRTGTLIYRTFLEEVPDTPELLTQLRDDLRAIQLYSGTLVSADEKSTAIMVGVPEGMDRTALYRELKEIIAAPDDIEDEVHVIGAPVAEALLGTHILEDLGIPAAVLPARTFADAADVTWRFPRSLYELRTLIARKIGLVPVALALMSLVFFAGFRSVAAFLLPLMEVGACLAFVFGLMGWLDVPVYLTTAVLPIVLTAIGVADEIHIFDRYRSSLRARPTDPRRSVLTATMNEMSSPVVKTSLTTSVGFLSFALSPISPVQAFGLFTAVGIVFCMLWSLTVVPASLVLLHPRWIAGRLPGLAAEPLSTRPSLLRGLTHGIIRLRWIVVLLAVAMVAAAPLGARRVRIQDSWIDGFAPESEFHRATTHFNEQFLGTHTLNVRVHTGEVDALKGIIPATAVEHQAVRLPVDQVGERFDIKGHKLYLRYASPEEREAMLRRHLRHVWDTRIVDVTVRGQDLVLTPSRRDGSPRLALRFRAIEEVEYEITPERMVEPEVVRAIERLEQFIEQQTDKAVGGVIGPSDYVKTTNFMARIREEARVIPDTSERIEWLWSQYGRVRGEERLAQTVTKDYSAALISVYMKNANFIDTQRLMEAIRAYEAEHLEPLGYSLAFAGDVAVSQTLIDAIVSTQVRSLLVSLVGILAVTSIMGRSLVWGLLSVLPCALAVLINFAVMGWTGMPLGVATSMFAGMTLGIGVDFAIHLLERYRLSRSHGFPVDDAIHDAVTATGPAILIDGLGVALGFGVMTLSQVPANARLGALVVLSIAGCFLATVILLPALLRLAKPRRA